MFHVMCKPVKFVKLVRLTHEFVKCYLTRLYLYEKLETVRRLRPSFYRRELVSRSHCSRRSPRCSVAPAGAIPRLRRQGIRRVPGRTCMARLNANLYPEPWTTHSRLL